MTTPATTDSLQILQQKNKELEQELLALKKVQEYQTIASDFSPVSITVSEFPSGIYTYVNESFERLSGYTAEEALGKTGVELGVWPSDERDRFHELIEKERILPNFESTFLTKSGEKGYGLSKAQLKVIQGKEYLIFVSKNNTRFKTAEFKLQNREQRIQALLNAPNYVICLLNTEAEILIGNENYYTLQKISPDEARHSSFFPFCGCPAEQVGMAAFQECLEAQKEVSITQKNDEGQYWRFQFFPIPTSEAYHLKQIAVFVQNITDEKTTEQTLLQAKHDIEGAAKAKSDFLDTISHELRTPLNGIMGMTTLLQNEAVSEIQTEYLDIIELCSGNLLEIINQIIDFSALDVQGLTPVHDNTCTEALVTRSLALSQPKIQQKQIELFYEIAEGTPAYIKIDQSKVEQVLISLIDNAIKFSDIGNIQLTVRSLSDAHEKFTELEFCVRDQGIGIDSTKVQHMLEPFTQVEDTSTRQYNGTGLGLAFCNKIVSLLDGKMTVESTEGIGTSISFTLPVQICPEPTEPENKQLPQFPGKNILIIDSNEDHRNYLIRVFHDLGINAFGVNPIGVSANDVSLKNIDLVVLNSPKEYGFVDFSEQLYFKLQQHNIGSMILVPEGAQQNSHKNHCYIQNKPVFKSEISHFLEIIFKQAPKNLEKHRIIHSSLQDDFPLKILIAEDNSLNRAILEQSLIAMGYEPLLAQDGLEALEVIKNDTIDLILLDIEMPNMNGFELAAYIIDNYPADQRPYLLAISAHDLELDPRNAKELGIQDYLRKPIDPIQLQDQIKRIALSFLSK